MNIIKFRHLVETYDGLTVTINKLTRLESLTICPRNETAERTTEMEEKLWCLIIRRTHNNGLILRY